MRDADTLTEPPQTSTVAAAEGGPPGVRARTRALMAHEESRHAVKYSVVGVVNVTIDLALYALLLSLGVWYVAAKALSLIAATANGYTFNRLWTFRAGEHHNMKLVRYVAVQGTGLVLNLALLALFVEGFGLTELAAALLAVAARRRLLLRPQPLVDVRRAHRAPASRRPRRTPHERADAPGSGAIRRYPRLRMSMVQERRVLR
jgi:putative flippase GtrA